MRTERSSATPQYYNLRNKTSKMSKLGALLRSDPNLSADEDEYYYDDDNRTSNASASSTSYCPSSAEASPYAFSPLNVSSPFTKSPWIIPSPMFNPFDPNNGLVGSLVREEGHVYSLAVSGDLLYTGSDSKNVRVWKNLKEFSGFKSHSGLVKAIVVSGQRVFTGHQDGKIRVWNHSGHKRVGTLPSFKDFVKCSINPSNYVRTRRHKSVVWIRHYDSVSCLTVNEDQGLLYSGSWDKTMKVWRVSDLKCIESVEAHDDAINAVAFGFDGLVFTGSADGTVKAWRRELHGRSTKHFLVQLLLKQDSAVTSLAVDRDSRTVYSGCSDGFVNFWEGVKRLSHGGALRGHKMAVLCLATGGSLVFSGSADKSICVWRRETGGVHTCLSVLTGHAGPVKCIASKEDEATYDGDRWWTVYSGSLDRSVKVWRVRENPPNYLDIKEYTTSVYSSPVDKRRTETNRYYN